MDYLDSYLSYTSTRKYGVPLYGQISTPLSEQIAFAGQISHEYDRLLSFHTTVLTELPSKE